MATSLFPFCLVLLGCTDGGDSSRERESASAAMRQELDATIAAVVPADAPRTGDSNPKESGCGSETDERAFDYGVEVSVEPSSVEQLLANTQALWEAAGGTVDARRKSVAVDRDNYYLSVIFHAHSSTALFLAQTRCL